MDHVNCSSSINKKLALRKYMEAYCFQNIGDPILLSIYLTVKKYTRIWTKKLERLRNFLEDIWKRMDKEIKRKP